VWLETGSLRRERARSDTPELEAAAGKSLPCTGVLHSVQEDVTTGNFCGCFWSDAFNNALLGRKCNVINSLVINKIAEIFQH
jgi:hypothetical protein